MSRNLSSPGGGRGESAVCPIQWCEITNELSGWTLMSHENSKAAVSLQQQLEIQTEQENEKTTE